MRGHDLKPPEVERRVPVTLQVLVMLLLGCAAFTAYLTRHCIAIANTTIQGDLRLDDETMGWVLGIFSVGYFFFQIPGGWLGSQWGTRRALAAIALFWSACTAWSSLAATGLNLLLSRAVFGAAQAGLVPLSAKVIHDWFPARRRGLCSAVMGAAMSLGGVVAMGLTARLLAHLPWRTVFQLYAVVGIGWAAVFFWCFRDRPSVHPWMNPGGREPVADPGPLDAASWQPDQSDCESASSGKGQVQAQAWTTVLSAMLLSPSLWGINLQSYFRAAGYGLLVTWFPAYLEYRFALTKDATGDYSMLPLLGVIVGTMCGGLLVDGLLAATGSKWLSRTGTALVSLSACGVLTLAATWTTDVQGFVLLIAAGALFSGLANPCAWAATMDVAGAQTSMIVGAMNMAGTLGGFTMPVVLGYLIGDIAERGGDWNLVVQFVGVVYLLGALSWLPVNPNSSPPGIQTPQTQ